MNWKENLSMTEQEMIWRSVNYGVLKTLAKRDDAVGKQARVNLMASKIRLAWQLAVVVLLVVVFLFAIAICATAQQPAAQKQAAPAPVQAQKATAPIGKVVTLPSTKVPRFERPIGKPHIERPTDRVGGNWHWHPRHGWVWLAPGVGVPTELVLPEAYALPQNVVYYQVEAVQAAPPLVFTVTCPHCGQAFKVRVQH
jgi:hypothetical protein